MGFYDFLFGKPEQVQQLPNYTPQQNRSMDQLLQGSTQQLPQMFQYLQSILSQDPELMNQFEAPARRAFQEQTIPSIAERFTDMGAQRSSAFGQQLGSAAAGLEENLASQRANLSSNAIQQLMQMLSAGNTQRFENVVRPETFGAVGNLFSGASQGAGQSGLMGLLKLFGL